MQDDRTGVSLTGKCLCGAVSLHLQHPRPTLNACHCNLCLKWTSGPFMTLDAHEAPHIEGEANVSVYRSSAWAERGFCAQCGTHLFYRLREGNLYALSAGLFEQAKQWPF